MSLIVRSLLIATALGAASAASGADADTPKSLAQAEMEIMDTNGDGKASAMEHTIGAKKIFEAMDANQNGMVTVSEMDAYLQTAGVQSAPGLSSSRMIDNADKDQDGELSAEEHFTFSRKLFDQMDSDGDRSLTLEEMETGYRRLIQERHAHDAN